MPKIWQEREDLNPRPLVLETSALARLSYAPAMSCANLGRRQPRTLTVDLPATNFYGTPGGTRTPDARLRTPPLYPTELQGQMVEIGGLEPASEATSPHSTIPDALRNIAQGFVQLANALESEGGPLLDLAPVLHGLCNGRHSNRGDGPNP